MKLIVGLGNPDKKYEKTRHNFGFMVLDKLAEDRGLDEWILKDKFKALITETGEGKDKIILAKPQTFMNLSGESVLALKQFYKLENADITVIHDDVDIPFGVVREKQGGGTAGHNGLESVVGYIGDDFRRIRVGVKNPLLELVDTSKFVLANFTPNEVEKLDEIIKAAIFKI